MIPKRLGLGLLVLVPLFIIPSAAGTQATVTATATIGGTGLNHTLTIKNTGPDPIKFWRYNLPAGVLVTAGGTQPAGWQLGSSGPLPQPVFGGRGDPGIPPGGSAAFPFTTNVGYHTLGNLGVLFVSSTGLAGSDVPAPLGLETSPPKPQPPCKCTALTAGTQKAGGAVALGKKTLDLRLDVVWTLTCTRGARGCRGKVELLVPPPLARSHDLEVTSPKDGLLVCKGPCGKETHGEKVFVVKSGPSLGLGKRGVKTRSIELDQRTTCGTKMKTKRLTIVFNDRGRADWDRSDLNGNDVPDGTENK